MLIPPYLKKGSTIAVVATARTADSQQIESSKKILEDQGFKIILAPNISASHHRFAGDDPSRRKAFQEALDDEKIDAIWLARGGYATVRIIDEIDWTNFLKSPKWIIGFSDFTLVHLKLLQLGIASIHACTFTQIQKFGVANENVISTLELLLNQNRKYSFPGSSFNKTGEIKAPLVGGNLTMICNSIGTPTQIKTEGCILLLEDCDEYQYHYDRMLRQLKRAGLLKNLKGLILGDCSFQPEPGEINFGYSIEEMVLNLCSEYNFPICFNAPFGHAAQNYGVKLNSTVSLDVSIEGVILEMID